MSLAIIEHVRQAVTSGHALKQSDVLALCATAEQLWNQTVSKHKPSARTQYMREYMRRWRADRRAKAANT